VVDVRNHPGMHVEVNLEGLTIDGVVGPPGWLPGVVIGVSALGSQPSVQLDTPIGGGVAHRLLHRPSPGVDLVSLEMDRVRPIATAQAMPNGIPQEIIDLAHAGKTKEAIKRYRMLNGASLQEAITAVNNL
jgi:hypothetical protein